MVEDDDMDARSDHEVRTYEGEWHLDKRVPIALITTLCIQMGLFIWWAGRLSERVDNLERIATTNAPQAGQILVLSTKVDAINGTLTEIKGMIRGTREPRP
jgi:hypothetical protein